MRASTFLAAAALAAGLAVGGAGAQDAATNATPSVNFNFDQADIQLITKLVGELTGKRFIIDDSVKGKVTVVTPAPVPLKDIYPLFQNILESSGYGILERKEGLHIVALPEKGRATAPFVLQGEAGHEGLITRIIKINNISAVELKKLLEPLVRGGKEGAVAALGSTNHLLITDTAENIRQIEKLIGELDKPGAARTVDVLTLRHTSAADISRQIVAAMMGATSAGDRVSRHLQQVGEGGASLPSDLVVVPAIQANSLIVVGTSGQLDEVRRIVEKMDVESPSGYGNLNAIFLKYLTAEDAAKNLNALLAKMVEKDQKNPIALEANPANNALIVNATPQDFEVVKKLVADLDVIPQQVLVEVLIAEVSGDKSLDFGVEFSTIDAPEAGVSTAIGRSRPGSSDTLLDAVSKGIFPQGLAVGVAHGTYTDASGVVLPRIPVLIQALAQNKDVKILANLPLWAQNNTEATVNVVNNIPILRSTIEGGAGTSRDVIQNIDRMDVGIKLKIKPHVNPDREILMTLNPTIEAIVDQGSETTQFTPTIAKRDVNTTVTVPDRSTIIISGLMREDRVKQVFKVPFLGDLPLLGWLFRSQSEKTEKTNLLIFVTPHIVTTPQEAEAMKKALQDKTKIDVSEAALPKLRALGN